MTSTSRQGAFAALLVAALATAACGGSDDGGGTRNDVVMRLIAYQPESLTVPAGATITWRQMDAGVHTVTSGTVAPGAAGVSTQPDGTFDSGNLATDATFDFTFEKPGTYRYFCAVHPATMRGRITVA